MKILVTGATGFIGHHLVKRLISQNHEVSILSRSRNISDELSQYPLKIIVGDITDNLSVLKATEDQERVYHLAGMIAYKPADRPAMEKINVQGTQKLVDACVTHQTPEVVYMSSVVAIGASFDGQVLNENSPYNVAHLKLGYFDTKHAAEKIVQTAVEHNHLRAFILNPSTVHGAGDAIKGSRSVQKKVAQGRFPFIPPGGVNVVHVNDVLYCLEQLPLRGRPGERYIVAGENLLLKDVFARIAQIAGVKPPRWPLPKSALHLMGWFGDSILEPLGIRGPLNRETAWTSTLYHWFSSHKAQQELGLQVTPAQKALEESVLWIKKHNL